MCVTDFSSHDCAILYVTCAKVNEIMYNRKPEIGDRLIWGKCMSGYVLFRE